MKKRSAEEQREYMRQYRLNKRKRPLDEPDMSKPAPKPEPQPDMKEPALKPKGEHKIINVLREYKIKPEDLGIKFAPDGGPIYINDDVTPEQIQGLMRVLKAMRGQVEGNEQCYWGGMLDPSTDSDADKKRVVKRDGDIVYLADGSIARDWNGALQMIHFHHDETCRQSWEAKLKAEEVLGVKDEEPV